MNWEFEEIKYIGLLLLLPLLIWRVVYIYRWKKRALNNFADKELQKRIFGITNFRELIQGNIGVILIFIFIIIALMNPLGRAEKQEVKRAGIDIVFALDISNSMNAEDVAPSRLLKAKKIISDILLQLGGDRVGIVIFAGKAYPLMPLSDDYQASNIQINEISPASLQGNQGTNIADAITKASEMMINTPNTSKAIILISDGEAHEGEIDGSIGLANKQEITIFSIGMGSSTGAPIPITHEDGYREYKKDNNGKIIITKLNDYSMRKIARETQGDYYSGSVYTKNIVDNIFSSLSKLEKKEIKTNYTYSSQQFFQFFIGVAVFLLILISLTTYKRDFNI